MSFISLLSPSDGQEGKTGNLPEIVSDGIVKFSQSSR